MQLLCVSIYPIHLGQKSYAHMPISCVDAWRQKTVSMDIHICMLSHIVHNKTRPELPNRKGQFIILLVEHAYITYTYLSYIIIH